MQLRVAPTPTHPPFQNCSLVRCVTSKENHLKFSDDLQIVLEIVIAIIVCLGEFDMIEPVTLGAVSISLIALRGAISLKNSDSKTTIAIIVVSTLAMIAAAAFVITGDLEPIPFGVTALVIDLSGLLIRQIDIRCAKKENRYTF